EKARREAEEKARREEEEKARREAEEKARREAEEKARREAEEKARREEEEQIRLAIEAKARALEEAKARAKAEAVARVLEEAKAKREAEEKERMEIEVRARLLEETKSRIEAEARAISEMEAELSRLKSKASQLSTFSDVAVLYIEFIGDRHLLAGIRNELRDELRNSHSIGQKDLSEGHTILQEVEDGVVITFMQSPEHAISLVLELKQVLDSYSRDSNAKLNSRMGIHLGTVTVETDASDLEKVFGECFDDAHRIMSIADNNQVLASESYFDFLSANNREYSDRFESLGTVNDRSGGSYFVYKLLNVEDHIDAPVAQQAGSAAADTKLEPFTFNIPETAIAHGNSVNDAELGMPNRDAALLRDVVQISRRNDGKSTSANAITEDSRESQAISDDVSSAPAVEPTVYGAPPEEIRKLEEAQAKVWAEAEQKAKDAAKAKQMWNAQQSPVQKPAPRKAFLPVRVKRKSIPWFQLAAETIIVVLVILFAVPYVVPTKDFVPKIERFLNSKLHQPVYIARIDWQVLPTPKLDLIDLSIGDTKQLKIKLARINFSPLAVINESRTVDVLELGDIVVEAKSLQSVSEWFQQIAADKDFPIAAMSLNNGKLEMAGFEVSAITGELNFDQTGKFSAGNLRANSYVLAMDSATPNKTRVSISVRGGALPLLPNWVFDELTVNGELTGSEFVISEFDGQIMGGLLRGTARLNWNSGWTAQGTLEGRNISLEKMLKSMSGELDGNAKFQMEDASLIQLADSAVLNGSFTARKGAINGIDVVETARLRSAENLPGGRTHFDELAGDISYAKKIYNIRQFRLNTGVLQARGRLNYTGQDVTGSLTADLALRDGTQTVTLQVGGTADNPTLRAAH
ncbi:MAG: hypothetical protein WA632_00425, partial [Gallionella sp.]